MGELWTNRNHDRALQHVHRAIELNPSASQTYHFGGCMTGFAGDPSVARTHQLRIGRLDIAYPYAAVIQSDLGLWHMLEGDYGAAEDHLTRAEVLDPGHRNAAIAPQRASVRFPSTLTRSTAPRPLMS